jgi:hypothetical protein
MGGDGADHVPVLGMVSRPAAYASRSLGERTKMVGMATCVRAMPSDTPTSGRRRSAIRRGPTGNARRDSASTPRIEKGLARRIPKPELIHPVKCATSKLARRVGMTRFCAGVISSLGSAWGWPLASDSRRAFSSWPPWRVRFAMIGGTRGIGDIVAVLTRLA